MATYEEKVMKTLLTGCKATQRTKLSDIIRVNAYSDIINNIGWSMYEWKGLPEELSSDEIERAVCCGVAAVFKVPEETGSASSGMYVAAPLKWVGVQKADNTADSFICTIPFSDMTVTSNQLDGKYVIVRNNFEMTSDYDFTEWTAQMLNETDISENQLIKWSRMTPIAKATSNADIAKIEEILQRVYNGEPWAVMSDFSKVMTGVSNTRDDVVLRLTDETAIEKMHFLSEFHYELIRRICNLYNIPFHTTAKSAQNLESELHNTDIFSRMLPEKRLQWRRKSLDDFKRVFGWDVTVDMSAMFKKENEVIDNVIADTAPDAQNGTQNAPDDTTKGNNTDDSEGGRNE